MIRNFTLIKSGDFHILKRNSYPRFTITVDLRKPVPEIINIEFDDICSAHEMAKAINDIGIFLETFNLESDE